MTKNIVFCADGTWNGPGESTDGQVSNTTNVLKLFLDLGGTDSPATTQLAKEQERSLVDATGAVTQIAKYLHGVGDSDNFLVKVMGGTVGAGLITRIVRGYTFVSRNYKPGDKIYLIGFSRGAYTARALAGLIAAKGLIDAAKIDMSDRRQAYRLGAAVWFSYRKAVLAGKGNWLTSLEEFVLDLPAFVTMSPTPELIAEIPIEAVAVWDTVGALGIPEFNLQLERIDAFQFCDTELSPKVANGFHAVAVDEERADFVPTLWNDDRRILQVLFPGAHADVGGGYPDENGESGLSDCALSWMISRLNLHMMATVPVRPVPNPQGVAHQPWIHAPWNILLPPPRPRGFPSAPHKLALHQSVLDRINGAPVVYEPDFPAAPYRPTNLDAYVRNGVAMADVNVVR